MTGVQTCALPIYIADSENQKNLESAVDLCVESISDLRKFTDLYDYEDYGVYLNLGWFILEKYFCEKNIESKKPENEDLDEAITQLGKSLYLCEDECPEDYENLAIIHQYISRAYDEMGRNVEDSDKKIELLKKAEEYQEKCANYTAEADDIYVLASIQKDIYSMTKDPKIITNSLENLKMSYELDGNEETKKEIDDLKKDLSDLIAD